MGFESNGLNNFSEVSPGGHVFGVENWTWGPPIPRSITFFLDGSAVVCDQYGRHIVAANLEDGTIVKFADSPPDANSEGRIVPRPQFATHAQVLEALKAEGIDWTSYEVRWQDRSRQKKNQTNLTLDRAQKLQARLIQDGNNPVQLGRSISCAGWPQLPYAELKKMPDVPPTPADELAKILDPALRRDALRLRRETDEIRSKELQPVEVE